LFLKERIIMTATLERYTTHPSRGDEAYGLIDKYREEMGEEFELRPLDTEFAFYMHRLGVNGLYLADAANNHAGTFKWRGALNKMAALQNEGIESVVVPSAGNHLRGAVMAAKVLGMQLHGVVPTSAPSTKKEGARELWGDEPGFRLHVVGDTFDDSLAHARENSHLGELVHPFDDELVSEGQGTIVDDIIDAAIAQGVAIKHIVVALGGGGLATGVAKRAEERGLSLTVHAVEAEGSDSLSQSVKAGRIIAATKPNLRYGGSAVKHTGRRTLSAYRALPNMRLWQATDNEVRALVDDYEDEIHYRELDKFPSFVPFEPTTLVAIAGLAQIAREYPEEGIAVVGTGRNDSLSTVWRP
jgi:threonine dehydratase